MAKNLGQEFLFGVKFGNLINGLFTDKDIMLSLVSQFWEHTVNISSCYSQNCEQYGDISPSYSEPKYGDGKFSLCYS